MSTVELTDFATAEAALREADLKQSLYNEGSVLMDRVLVTLHGDEHRQRRLTEMRVFRRDFFRHYEQSVMPGIFAEVMAQVERGDSVNLVDLNYRFMVYLALTFAGVDRQSGTLAELETLIQTLRMFGVAATLGQARQTRDRASTRAEVEACLRAFDRDFFSPSARRRQRLIDQVGRGELGEAELPMDVLTVLLGNAHELGIARDMVLRETGFFFLASAHTSVHSLGHAVHHLLEWCEDHAGARSQLHGDPVLVQRFVHESFRLHPSSPVAKREALARVEFLDGQVAEPGDTVVINLRQANRDVTVFGTDAESFNPYREVRRGISETGITFGTGMHACLGKNLAAGMLPVAGRPIDASSHQLGTVAWISHALLAAGAVRDRSQAAELDASIERETWQTYPIRFDA